MAWHDSNVILCGWRISAGSYVLWIIEKPSLTACAEDFQSAEEKLREVVYEAAPDYDAIDPVCFEFDPPLPAAAELARFLQPELYIITGNGCFDPAVSRASTRELFPTLYERGICKSCEASIGERTERPLFVDHADKADAGLVRFCGDPLRHVYSEHFLTLLTSAEVSRLVLRPVEVHDKSYRRKLYELCNSPDIEFVAVKGFDTSGSTCTVCGHESFYVSEPWIEEACGGIWYFVCLDDLPRPVPDVFIVGRGKNVSLCFTRHRWDEIRGRPGTRAVMSRPLGVISEKLADRLPRLRRRGVPCATCENWPKPLAIDSRHCCVFDLKSPIWSTRNLSWIRPAQMNNELVIVRETKSIEQIDSMLDRKERPQRPEVVSFRCPECWRLGRIIVTKKEVRFIWN